MNIFYLDSDPEVCAKYHNDKHVVKMILETAQLLSQAHYAFETCLDTQDICKKSERHWNHPCTIWTRTSLSNYNWLCRLGQELCKEYTFRYEKVHARESTIYLLTEFPPDIPDLGFTEPKRAFDKYIEVCYHDNIIESYRLYYIIAKQHLAKWKNRAIPEWYKINDS